LVDAVRVRSAWKQVSSLACRFFYAGVKGSGGNKAWCREGKEGGAREKLGSGEKEGDGEEMIPESRNGRRRRRKGEKEGDRQLSDCPPLSI
jgi:hypothetical protein